MASHTYQTRAAEAADLRQKIAGHDTFAADFARVNANLTPTERATWAHTHAVRTEERKYLHRRLVQVEKDMKR